MDGSGKPWVCTTGKQQSPINLLTAQSATTVSAVANEHRAVFQLGAVTANGTSVRLTNNGHSVQVSWTDVGFAPKVLITVKGESHGSASSSWVASSWPTVQ